MDRLSMKIVRALNLISIVGILSIAFECRAAGDYTPGSPPASLGQSIDPQSLPRTFGHEADKAEIFQRYAQIITKQSTDRRTKEEVAFCQAFGDDLRALRGINFIEPIARGEDISDPKLHAYWPQCSKFQPEKILWPPVYSPGMEQREYYRTSSVVLYYINALNEHPQVQRYLVFAQGLCTRDSTHKCFRPNYEIVDAKKCTLTVVNNGDDTFENLWRNEYGISAVILYKQKYFYLGIEDEGGNKFMYLFYRQKNQEKIIIAHLV